MQVEYGDDNRFKKRVTKKFKQTFADDQGYAPSLGTTKPDAKAFDSLEDALENVETKAQLVINQLERDAAVRAQDPSIEPPSGITSFYASVQSAVSALKKTNFKGLPRTDIASLESYLGRLSEFDIEGEFNALLSNFRVEPARRRASEARLDADARARVAIIERLNAEIFRLTDQRQRLQADLLTASRDPRFPAYERRQYEDNIAAITFELENKSNELKDLEINQKEQTRIRSTRTSKSSTVMADMQLVVPLYNQLLKSLENGLQSYTSGVSGKNVIVEKQELVGLGSYHIGMGGQDYLPRRYL